MKVKELQSKELKRSLEIEISAEEIETQRKAMLLKIGQTAKVPGFRPGKIPAELLEQRYGDSVMSDVVDELIRSSVPRALKESSARPAYQPSVEIKDFQMGKPLTFTINFEVLPEIQDIDYKKIKLQKYVCPASDADVDEALKNLAAEVKNFQPIEKKRKSKKGDSLLIDFKGIVDGKTFEGGSSKDYTLELGSGHFIPGFEEQLIGAEAGDDVNVNVKFPEDYPAKSLAGKDTLFEVKVKQILEIQPVELNDAFAQRFGIKTLAELKDALKKNISAQHDGLTRQLLKRTLLDHLDQSYDFNLPERMVEQTLRGIKGEPEEPHVHGPNCNHDHDHDDHAGHDHGPDEECTHKEEKKAKKTTKKSASAKSESSSEDFDALAIAKRQVKLGLLFSEVAEKNSLKVEPHEIENEIHKRARQFPGKTKEVFDYFSKNPDAIRAMHGPILENKVVDYILELSKIEEKEVTIEQLKEKIEE